MTDWPNIGDPTHILISPHTALGIEYAGLAIAGPASVAHGTVNLARFYPFTLPEPIVVVKLWWANGATANGNTDVGIYTEDGTRIVSTGATAQGTVSVLQEVDITDTQLGRGRYYLGLSSSSATATYLSNAMSVSLSKMLGWAEVASAHPLPATTTLAAFSTAAIQPIFGLSQRTLVA